MSNDKIMSVAELVKLFKRLQRNASTEEEFEELDFYETVFELLYNNLKSRSIENLIPIRFNFCSTAKAQKLAFPLDLAIVEGGSGTLYLSVSDKLIVD